MTTSERYVELALRLGRHEDDLVDSIYGWGDLRDRVDSEELQEPRSLAEDAGALLEDVTGDPWLEAQVRGRAAAGARVAHVVGDDGEPGAEPARHVFRALAHFGCQREQHRWRVNADALVRKKQAMKLHHRYAVVDR